MPALSVVPNCCSLLILGGLTYGESKIEYATPITAKDAQYGIKGTPPAYKTSSIEESLTPFAKIASPMIATTMASQVEAEKTLKATGWIILGTFNSCHGLGLVTLWGKEINAPKGEEPTAKVIKLKGAKI